jgi:hypothetical protein
MIVLGGDKQAQSAQPKHVGGNRAPGCRRWVVTPVRRLEIRGRNRPPGVHCQPSQDASLATAARGDFACAVAHDQRTEEGHLHPLTLAEPPGPPGVRRPRRG